jgi:Pyrimidine dimer DNA glycosylase
VQTFVPLPAFTGTAAVLDPRRLGKQRVEVLQILRALTRPGYGWANHPAVLMWRGSEEALVAYGLAVCAEWSARGMTDTVAAKLRDEVGVPVVRPERDLATAGALPAWWGDDAVHRSHRSALVRKDPGWYRRLWPDEPDDLPYVWPVRSPGAIAAERRRAEAAARRARAAGGDAGG